MTKCISNLYSFTIVLQISNDFIAFVLLNSNKSRSARFALLFTLFNSVSKLNSEISLSSDINSPNSNPLIVSTTTLSPLCTSKSVEKKYDLPTLLKRTSANFSSILIPFYILHIILSINKRTFAFVLNKYSVFKTKSIFSIIFSGLSSIFSNKLLYEE